MASKSPLKSSLWNGSSSLRAAFRSSSVVAMIIRTTTGRRSGAKNMCSVRQRPMPWAPSAMAILASRGMSAFARSLSVRTSSAHFINVSK